MVILVTRSRQTSHGACPRGNLAFLGGGLMIAAMQAMTINSFFNSSNPDAEAFRSHLHATHRVLLIYLPILTATGIAFATFGRRTYRGSPSARRAAQITALLCFAWMIPYLIQADALTDMPGATMPKPAWYQRSETIFRWASRIGGSALLFAIPTLLFAANSRPRKPAGEELGQPTS